MYTTSKVCLVSGICGSMVCSVKVGGMWREVVCQILRMVLLSSYQNWAARTWCMVGQGAVSFQTFKFESL